MAHAIELKAGGDLIVGDVLADFTDVVNDGTGTLLAQEGIVTGIVADPNTGAIAVTFDIRWNSTVVNTLTQSIRRIQAVPVVTGNLSEFLP